MRRAASPAPNDAQARRTAPPVVVYPVGTLPQPDLGLLDGARQRLSTIAEVVVPPRDARAFRVPKGHFFRIVSIEGPQVGDLNLWSDHDLGERFFSGKTRALHATHVSTGDRLWSTLPYLRPMATITHDTLAWYGWDEDGAGVHDVIGTRCDPYTNRLLSGGDYHHCCHSNLARALAADRGHGRARGGTHGPRRAERLHVHGLHARHASVFHEGEPGAAGRFHRVLRRDRSARRALGVPRRGLRRDAFERHRRMLSRSRSRSCGRTRVRSRVGTRPSRAVIRERTGSVDHRLRHPRPELSGEPRTSGREWRPNGALSCTRSSGRRWRAARG